MGVLDSLFGGLSEDRKNKDKFTQNIKSAGRAYIIDSGIYVQGPYEVEKPISGTVYVNKRGLFFQAVPASRCVIAYVENIKSVEIAGPKKKLLSLDYENEGNNQKLVIEVTDPKGCIKELERAIREYNENKQDDKKIFDMDENKTSNPNEILETIEKLAKFRDSGVITDEEFLTKKEELLKRL